MPLTFESYRIGLPGEFTPDHPQTAFMTCNVSATCKENGKVASFRYVMGRALFGDFARPDLERLLMNKAAERFASLQ